MNVHILTTKIQCTQHTHTLTYIIYYLLNVHFYARISFDSVACEIFDTYVLMTSYTAKWPAPKDTMGRDALKFCKFNLRWKNFTSWHSKRHSKR